jgi:hypothetical protein
MKERNLLLAVAALVIVIAAAFALSSPRGGRFKADEAGGNDIAAADERTQRPSRTASQLCGSSAGFQQLKAAAFEEAIRARGEPANLQRLAASSVVRMENVQSTGEDAETGAVSCSGRFVIELPPGAERGFGGQRRLSADIVYAAEPGADGGAAVYRLVNADALVSSLAAFDVDSSLQPAQPAETELADATPADQLPVIIRPDPEDRPAPRPEPARPEPARPTPAPRAEREEPAPRPAPARAEREKAAPRPAPQRPAPAPTRAAPERQAQRTARPSFSCGSARSRSERMVCSSDRLAAKDRAMSSLFFSALNNADSRTRAELQRTRNRFLSYRERCQSEACISEAYDGRMQEIRDIVELAQ